jgi:hypothetical protein
VTITTFSSREFNRDCSRAKKAALEGPVFITDRGRPSHVLLTVGEYQRISGERLSIVDALAMRDGSEFEFEPPKLGDGLYRAADLD